MAKKLDHTKLNLFKVSRRPEDTTPLRVWRAKNLAERADAIIAEGERRHRPELSTANKSYRKFGGNHRLVMECWLRQRGVPVKGCELRFGALEHLIRRHPACPPSVSQIPVQAAKEDRRRLIAAALRLELGA
jgi:hypothetical protein